MSCQSNSFCPAFQSLRRLVTVPTQYSSSGSGISSCGHVGAMGDDQRTDEYTVSICVKDFRSPITMTSVNTLVAKEQDIPFKLDIYPFYGSNASLTMSAGAGSKLELVLSQSLTNEHTLIPSSGD